MSGPLGILRKKVTLLAPDSEKRSQVNALGIRPNQNNQFSKSRQPLFNLNASSPLSSCMNISRLQLICHDRFLTSLANLQIWLMLAVTSPWIIGHNPKKRRGSNKLILCNEPTAIYKFNYRNLKVDVQGLGT